MRLYFVLFVILLSSACSDTATRSSENSMTPNRVNNNAANVDTTKTPADISVYTYEIVNQFKHDSKAFTQGLVVHNGFFYESTGQYGDSTIRKVEIESGKVLQKRDLSENYFAEGITILNGKIYQITWRENIGFVYDLNDFKLLKEFRYQGEGWGLTNDGKNLILSDGTHVIRFLDPETFQTVRTISVFREVEKPLLDLNELEYVKGEIWANIWRADDPQILGKPNYIARIDPNSGKILGWIDLGNISPDDVRRNPSSNTLNGIAYDEATDRIFVTGKNWKKLFEIKVKAK
ncbi:MAG TPA: glutaminyl-peptide cyclotransferase [Pyrinomonadaceae bacterium]|nr:glutaminyl-peptide cyclotransferase [Pyrinomonadaceae bacterium]